MSSDDLDHRRILLEVAEIKVGNLLDQVGPVVVVVTLSCCSLQPVIGVGRATEIPNGIQLLLIRHIAFSSGAKWLWVWKAIDSRFCRCDKCRLVNSIQRA